ncbi:N(6)-adenine-specific methyltransferase METTL4 isoform X2 [Gambusia affinis]|uniref:N(6)-adenine-specific methyltransferase METTL4 isoform X2 n=1 Tax=Gambusia affinis TaxID=33528 RepID=UPI001CDCAA3A|nr:N(6)-adenine-specific methyltransferase METTL4 isoform X2 [Gambusia affinis]
MSVVLQSSSGWVLDSQSLIDRGYTRCITWRGHQKSHVKCNFKRQCFHILKSHYNISGRVDGGHSVMTQKTEKSAKKRKRKHCELNQGEIDAKAFHEKDCRLAALCDIAKELPLLADEEQEWTQSLLTEEGGASHVDLFSKVTENIQAWAAVVPLMGEEYIIPPNTAFLLSDFTRIQPLVQCGRRFDVIVIDPPWENKSVKRSRRYSSLPSSQMKRLPVPLLGSPGCLVATWVTNRPSHLRFVRDELYPHWGVEVVAEWFWVKVTTSGEFVFPLDSPHKKPYEVLVLGRYRPANDHTSPLQTANVPVEDKRLIVSVPSALHSQKPSLSEVLKLYVGAEAKCLELFARSLQPRWTSWGNEVLKFQHVSYFNLGPADTSKAEATEDAADNRAET